MNVLEAVSLFAGVGGIDLGLHRAGIRTVAAVEIDRAARGVYADHWPDVTLLDDVTEVSGVDLVTAGFDPRRGILAAGWPCTGNSIAGRREGMADPRSGLWVHVARLLAELRPAWFLGENVPGLLSVNGGQDFATVLGDLAELGYGFCWRVLDAQYFGVPQRRRRVIIVGHLGDSAGPVQVLLEPDSGPRDSAPRRQAGPGAAAVAALCAAGGGADDNDATAGRLIVGPLQAHGADGRGHRVDAEGAATGHLVAMSLAVGQDFSTGTEVAQPVTGSHGQPGAVGVGTSVRRLTPRECERLQGLPDDWTATSWGRSQSDSARYRQIGNSVAVPVIEWVARRIATVDREAA